MPRIAHAWHRTLRGRRRAIRPPGQQGASAGGTAMRLRSAGSALLVGAITGAVCAGAATLALGVGAVTAAPKPSDATGTAATNTIQAAPDAATTTPAAAPTPTSKPPDSTAPPPGRKIPAFITFYSAGDHDPPGSREISNPNKRHSQAGEIGTYSNPITMAGDPRAVKMGTVAYYPALRKYFVMEDTCATCVADWSESRRLHVDLWAGATIDDGIQACLLQLTPDAASSIELDAPPGRTVNTTPLYSNGQCRG